MKKTLLLVVVLVLIGLGFWFWRKPAAVTPAATESPAAVLSPQTKAASKSVTAVVSISNFSFSPNRIQVKKGETVVWTNKDAVAHTVTSDAGAFDSRSLQQNESVSFSLAKAGSYPYHCAFHPNMHGVIEVTE